MRRRHDGESGAHGRAIGVTMALPFLKFYPSNWRADAGIRSSSLAARGFWAECLFLMHEATPRGYLVIQGKPPTDRALAVQVGATPAEVKRYRRELLEQGVAEVTREGVLFSRKMVRDEVRRQNGSKGGNPQLVGEPQSSDNQNPQSSVNRELQISDNQEPPSLVNQKPNHSGRSHARTCDRDPRDLETRSQIRTGGVLSRTEDGADTESPPALWRRLWDARWPEGICRTSHAELTELERLAAQLGSAELTARIERYVATDDTWLVDHKHPLGTFLRQINSYDGAKDMQAGRAEAVEAAKALKRVLWRAVGRDGRVWLESAIVTQDGATVRLETTTPDKLAPYHDTLLMAVRKELGGDVELAIVAADAGGI